ncbi:glycoside hydrolase family 3 C-terminal domain-containing protein [Streptomyces sp. NPDC088768]|uniref:glycoside hydrolase family 3 C-terminal domain-containing protein n=1 Tax=Streptomyces sp. NPDC088768 TaxID=3365894 RepID=UPI0037FEDB3F
MTSPTRPPVPSGSRPAPPAATGPSAPLPPTALPLAAKAALTSGAGDFVTEGNTAAGIAAVTLSDGPHGLRLPRRSGDGGQLELRSASPATCFPPAVALGNSWDPALARRVAGALAAEARAYGVGVVLGPGINLKRSPLCGRNFEYFSEDPLLSAALGGAMVEGLQTAGVGASLKHYAANNQETDRMRVSADIDERPLRELYLRAFERVVRTARPWSVMAAYNAVNGTPVTENARLLTEILRGEWGFDGIVVSDWGAVRDRVSALRAGLDLQMPSVGGRTDREVVAAVERGLLDEAVLDRSVARLALFARRAGGARGDGGGGASAPQVSATDAADGSTASAPALAALAEAHHRLAAEAAERCVVLLRNEGGLLPLSPATGRLAVVGELARTPRYQGGGSSQVTPTRLDTPLDALRARAEGAEVEFAPGYALPGTPPDAAGSPDAEALTAEAVALAARAGTVVLFLGLPLAEESEGFDRTHLDLPGEQLALLAELAEVNPRVVVVLSHGGVVRTAPWQDRVPALLDGALLGQAGGSALARVLYGTVNPSGRLAETVPVRLADSPSHLSFPGEEGHVRYAEGVFVGYRGYDATGREVSFPFGHGLSYTSFAYRALTVATTEDGTLRAHVTVANTGERHGREIIQLYSRPPRGSRGAHPVRELRAFTAVDLAPGEERTVTLAVPRAELAFWSVRENGWHVEGGTYRIDVGASSRDIRLSAEAEVAADPSRVRLNGRSTLGEWLSHPVGSAVLQRHIAAARAASGTSGAATGLTDPAVLRFLRDTPLAVIADFPISPVIPEELPALAEAVEAALAEDDDPS